MSSLERSGLEIKWWKHQSEQEKIVVILTYEGSGVQVLSSPRRSQRLIQ
jgi:hypothetical protein